ncbi:hypothetical protein H0H92_012017 [Tricholoma furcatifolium]|nr:hypothetical protein H0H92_012017 [Tricholoma furcatifolium]
MLHSGEPDIFSKSLLLTFGGLDPIDNFFEGSLISLPNSGPLSDFCQAPLNTFSQSIVEGGTPLRALRPLMLINDDLVSRMKRPVELPSSDENNPTGYTASGLGRLSRPSTPTSTPRRHAPSLLPLGSARQERYTILGDSGNYYLGPATESDAQKSPRSLNFVLPKHQPQQVHIPSLPPLSPSHQTYYR